MSALVVLDPELAPGWFADRGIEAGSLAELATDPQAHDAVQRAVDEVMGQFSNVERVKKVELLPEEWLPDGDELTPTSKLKRRSILAKYADRIDAICGRLQGDPVGITPAGSAAPRSSASWWSPGCPRG